MPKRETGSAWTDALRGRGVPQRDDVEAWRRLDALARRIARRVARGAGDAADLGQGALLALLEAEARGAFDASRSPGAYVVQAVRNQAANERRNSAVRERARCADADAVIARTRALPLDLDAAADARAVLHALRAEEREWLEACYLDGLTYAELAARVGRSVAAVNMRLHRLRRALEERMRA